MANTNTSTESTWSTAEVPVPKDINRNGTPTSLCSTPFSSERFNFVYSEEEESDAVDSVDQATQLFAGFARSPPTIEKALESMEYEKAKELARHFMEKAAEKLKELDAPGLTVEDIAAIFCYTFEWDADTFGEGESPYRKLNNSLSVNRGNAALKKTRGFLFLLLQALRKLPRFIPESHALYRGLRVLVQTEIDPEFPERKPYAAGNEKTWWAFTSTTTSLEVTQAFLEATGGTLIVLGGNPWGYDISILSDFPGEKEILMEPERKLRVTNVYKEGQLITVNAEMLSTPVVLDSVVKTPKHVRDVKEKKSICEVPKDLKAESTTDSTIELLWTPVAVKGKEVKYQVVMKKAGFFNRSTETAYDGTEAKCVVGNLEPWTEYEFQVRCKISSGGWSKWSDKVVMKTKAPPPNNLTTKAESWDAISLSWDPVTVRSGGAIGYTVEMKKERDNNEFTEIYKGTETRFMKIGLSQDTEYSFRVCVVCGNETGEWSDVVCEKTQKVPIPGYFSARAESWDMISLSWDPVTVRPGKAVGYVIEMKGDKESEFTEIYKGAETKFTRTKLHQDTVYGFRVRTVCGNESSEWSVVAKEKTQKVPVPMGLKTESISLDTINLSWVPVAAKSDVVIKYAVEMKKERDNNEFTVIYKGTDPKFVTRRLLPDTVYSFRVCVICGKETGEWSDVVCEKTQKVPAPKKPRGERKRLGRSRAVLGPSYVGGIWRSELCCRDEERGGQQIHRDLQRKQNEM